MQNGNQNLGRRLLARSYVFVALLLAVPAFAQPVGEQPAGAAAESGAFAELGNLSQIAGALTATLVHQSTQGRQLAGANHDVVVAPVPNSSLAGTSSEKTEAKSDGESIRKNGGSDSARTANAPSTSSLPSLIAPREMPDLAITPSDATRSVSRAPGAPSNWGGGTMTSMPEVLAIGGGSRGPAVLAKNDPTLRALSKTFNSLAVEREELAISKANQDALADLFNAAKKRKDAKSDKASKAEELAQKMFEESISDLMAREAPYEKKDYEDFRDFIAEQKDRLGETNVTATDFRNKAKEAFKMFHETDDSAQTMSRKDAYRRYISTEMTEEMQELMVTTPHADPMGTFGTTSH